MPIRREYRWFYPIDWPQLSAVIRFKRAGGRCEQCGRPHGRIVLALPDGGWWDGMEGTWRTGRGRLLQRRIPKAEQLVSLKATRVAWRLRIATTIPPTTARAISWRSARGVTSCMTGRSISGGDG